MFKQEWSRKTADTIKVDLWIGTGREGNRLLARGLAMTYCDSVGLCVSMSDTDFLFTNGCESGVRIGLRNYPRFPSKLLTLQNHAIELGMLLAERLQQGSFMIEGPHETIWFTRREGDDV